MRWSRTGPSLKRWQSGVREPIRPAWARSTIIAGEQKTAADEPSLQQSGVREPTVPPCHHLCFSCVRHPPRAACLAHQERPACQRSVGPATERGPIGTRAGNSSLRNRFPHRLLVPYLEPLRGPFSTRCLEAVVTRIEVAPDCSEGKQKALGMACQFEALQDPPSCTC